MTAGASLLSSRDRRRIAGRLAELRGLADLMREPGLLSGCDEAPALHGMARSGGEER